MADMAGVPRLSIPLAFLFSSNVIGTPAVFPGKKPLRGGVGCWVGFVWFGACFLLYESGRWQSGGRLGEFGPKKITMTW